MKTENEGHHTAHKTIENDICPLCDRVILSFNDLCSHIKTYHNSGNLILCENYDYSCTEKDRMKEHKRLVHMTQKGFECDYCTFVGRNEQKLSFHVIVNH